VTAEAVIHGENDECFLVVAVVVGGGTTTATGAPFFFAGRGLADQASHV
jgi:hypothetical protein